MPRKNIEKLLGGYATDTLTEQERHELFKAALHDQDLFNALANEQALKELLDDPRSRRSLVEALEQRASASWLKKLRLWFQRPSSWALAGSLTVGVLALSLAIQQTSPLPKPERPADKAPAASSPSPLEAPRPAEPTPPASDTTGKDAVEPALTDPSEAGGSAGMSTRRAPMAEEQAKSGRQGEQPVPAADAFRSQRLEPAQARSVGIRYAILRRRGAGDYVKVNAAADFRTGDSARIAVEPNEEGFFYLISIDALGTREVLFPKSKTEDSARVDKDTTYLFPLVGEIIFSEGVGERRFMLVFSQKPLPDIDAALKTAKTAGGSSGITLVELALKPHK